MIVEFRWKEKERIRGQVMKDHCICEILRDMDFILVQFILYMDHYSSLVENVFKGCEMGQGQQLDMLP